MLWFGCEGALEAMENVNKLGRLKPRQKGMQFLVIYEMTITVMSKRRWINYNY